jgi:hypothetical protein
MPEQFGQAAAPQLLTLSPTTVALAKLIGAASMDVNPATAALQVDVEITEPVVASGPVEEDTTSMVAAEEVAVSIQH